MMVALVRPPVATPAPTRTASGADVVSLARTHLGERYELGARAPMANRSWRGPWDCAEFASWCVYQVSGVLYGAEPQHDPVLADAYTGFWAEHARRDGSGVAIELAAATPGALLLRLPAASRIGHIAISDGSGGTVEAHSAATGVSQHRVSGRRWDFGVLVPGIAYFQNDRPVSVAPVAAGVLRVTHPLTRGPDVRRVQQTLRRLGFDPGSVDGVYGPQTADAVQRFQVGNGLVADGEVGPATRRALGM